MVTGAEFVVSASQVGHERRLAATACTDRERWSPRIGRGRTLSRPWSASILVFAYRWVTCSAAGRTSSITRGYTGAWSLLIWTGTAARRSTRAKYARAAAAVRRAPTKTSMTWPG